MSTPLMGYATPVTGSGAGTWGDTLNNTFTSYVDSNFAGLATLAITGATYSLSASEARCQMLHITGTLLQSCVISQGGGVLWNGIRCVENYTTGNFTITLSNGTSSVVIPQGRVGLVFSDSTYGLRFVAMGSSTNADTIPTGYPQPFYAAAPPSGWTQVTSLNDYALRIVSGTGAGTGGSVNFSTVFGRTATDSYTLLIADIPSHSHSVSGGIYGASDTDMFSHSSNAATPFHASAITIGNTGGGGGHAHGIDMRVKYADFILAQH